MPDTSRTDLELAWKERETEAALMITGGFHSMGLAFRLYSLEIRLKWFICRHLSLDYLPRACKTHDLSELIIYTGIWMELIDPANAKLLENWELLADFSKKRLNDIRYLPASVLLADELQQLTSALDDVTNGVLAWLSRHP